ncbi:MAG: hypothetical protein AAGA69_09630, partial [Pseudomonadota bacterium]
YLLPNGMDAQPTILLRSYRNGTRRRGGACPPTHRLAGTSPNGTGPRTFTAGPRRKGAKQADPDSPFAVLAALKGKD